MHERACAETVRAVIGKIRFADDEQTGDVAHQIVINPQSAHRVMDGGINSHRNFVGIFAGDLFVNLKQISVTLADCLFAETLDRVREIEINTATARADATAFVADFLGRARRDVARRKIAESSDTFVRDNNRDPFREFRLAISCNLPFVLGPKRVRRCATIRTSTSVLIGNRPSAECRWDGSG